MVAFNWSITLHCLLFHVYGWGEKITCTMHTILDAINTHRIVFLLLTNFSQIPTYRANWLPLSLEKKKFGAIC